MGELRLSFFAFVDHVVSKPDGHLFAIAIAGAVADCAALIRLRQ
jgi:hypothetical protein